MVSENGEEGWSDVVQENAILTGEVESLRRRVKAMQGTIDQLSARNSDLLAEKALAAWAPKDSSPDSNDCSLTALVQVCFNPLLDSIFHTSMLECDTFQVQ